jgi:hypothetical protein
VVDGVVILPSMSQLVFHHHHVTWQQKNANSTLEGQYTNVWLHHVATPVPTQSVLLTAQLRLGLWACSKTLARVSVQTLATLQSWDIIESVA